MYSERMSLLPASLARQERAWTLPVVLAALMALLSGCAPRQAFVQVPEIKVESVRLVSLTVPGFTAPPVANLTMKLRVYNPNAYAVRLVRAHGRFVLDGSDVGSVELPNIDLPARGEAQQDAHVSIPVSFSTVAPFLRVARGESVSYRIDGSFVLDAGIFGQPPFGPYTLAQGVIRQPAILP